MRILVLNWRDIKNPLAGGAEVVTHEVARRWVRQGHEVTVFAAGFAGCTQEEVVDGVRTVRAGGPLTVYKEARRVYEERFRGRFDLVIEEINALFPFFARFYMEEPVIALRHQNGRDFDRFEPTNSVSHYEFPAGLNFAAYILEPVLMRYLLGMPVLVMSESTRKDLLDLGHAPEELFIIPEGITAKPLPEIGQKEDVPTFIYVGRLKRSKRVDHVLKGFGSVRRRLPDAKLWVVGSGDPDLERELMGSAGDGVTFFGQVTEKRKQELMSRAHALIVTSVREGWGLVVTESNAMGTCAIGYDVPGLRDSIRDGETGLLVRNGDIDALTEGMLDLSKDDVLRKELTEKAWEWSKDFDFDRSASICMTNIEKALERMGANGTRKNVISIDLESWIHKDFLDIAEGKRKKMDAGNIADATGVTRTLLKRAGVRTTFFVVSEVHDWYPGLIDGLRKDGHEICFQTHTHKLLRNRKVLLDELRKGKGFIEEFSVKGFRAPQAYIRREHLPILRDWGFEFDSSVYAECRISEPVEGVLEVPISTVPRFGNGGAVTYPRNLTMGLVMKEVPFGSGYYLGLKGAGIIDLIEQAHRNGTHANMFVHTWQITDPPPGIPVERGFMENMRMRPYDRNRKDAVEELLKKVSFVPMGTLIKGPPHSSDKGGRKP